MGGNESSLCQVFLFFTLFKKSRQDLKKLSLTEFL